MTTLSVAVPVSAVHEFASLAKDAQCALGGFSPTVFADAQSFVTAMRAAAAKLAVMPGVENQLPSITYTLSFDTSGSNDAQTKSELRGWLAKRYTGAVNSDCKRIGPYLVTLLS